MTLQDLVEKWRREWPETFPGPRIDYWSGDSTIHWPSIQNMRSAGEIPDGCFITISRKIIVVRDPFLNWWLQYQLKAPRNLKPGPKNPPPNQLAAAAE